MARCQQRDADEPFPGRYSHRRSRNSSNQADEHASSFMNDTHAPVVDLYCYEGSSSQRIPGLSLEMRRMKTAYQVRPQVLARLRWDKSLIFSIAHAGDVESSEWTRIVFGVEVEIERAVREPAAFITSTVAPAEGLSRVALEATLTMRSRAASLWPSVYRNFPISLALEGPYGWSARPDFNSARSIGSLRRRMPVAAK